MKSRSQYLVTLKTVIINAPAAPRNGRSLRQKRWLIVVEPQRRLALANLH
jgi:hypothetical protein